MKKVIVSILIISILSTIFCSIKTFAETEYNQTIINPQNNGINSFPESYRILLNKLVQNGHTNWKFKAFYTNIEWDELVKNENIHMKNTIVKSSNTRYPDSWYDSCNGEGDKNYYCASEDIVNYYLDPRNFLTEVTIFEFLDLSNSNTVSIANIEKAVAGTYLQGYSSDEIKYSQMIYDAAKASGESAYSIIVKIFQEIGNGTELPDMISGTDSEYPNTYNFFNYGANDGDNNKKTALKYAKEEGWNTPYKALVEGAKKMANSYLKQGQNTKYTFKFDVVGKSFSELYTHQYMTNVQDPTFQAEMLYENYVQNNWLDNELTFIIPIYKNMPTYVKLPSNMEGNLYYVSSNWSGVYLRNGPGGRETNYENIMSVPRDSLVSVLESNINGWAKVDYNGVIGYMSEAFLTPVNKKKDTYKVPQSTELPFNDVGTNDWYYSSIKYTYQKGIIKGATETEFRPNAKFSRGMLVTILWRMEGEPKVTNAKEFADVTSGKYYYNAIKWATSKGIVNGYSNGKFGPEDNITREQLAVMLRNYAKYKGKNVSQTADISKYKDSERTSGYAKTSVQWAIAKGIISGKDNGTRIDPQGTASRAEAASMIYNYCTKIK